MLLRVRSLGGACWKGFEGVWVGTFDRGACQAARIRGGHRLPEPLRVSLRVCVAHCARLHSLSLASSTQPTGLGSWILPYLPASVRERSRFLLAFPEERDPVPASQSSAPWGGTVTLNDSCGWMGAGWMHECEHTVTVTRGDCMQSL